ncbi:unnamed protein product, partial [Ilex paraguariensis]
MSLGQMKKRKTGASQAKGEELAQCKKYSGDQHHSASFEVHDIILTQWDMPKGKGKI